MKTALIAALASLGLILGAGYGAFADGKPEFNADTFKEGKKIFKRKQCSGCHAIDTADDAEKGPGLKGIYAKRGREWLVKWLKDPEGMIQTDPDMKKLVGKYKEDMPNPELDDAQTDQVLLFLAYDGEAPK